MKKAIVISAGPLGLGIIRSLGSVGIKSIVIYENCYEVGALSKYCIEKVKISSYLEKKNIIDVLMQNRKRWKGLLLIPGNDESLESISIHKKLLEKYYIVYVPDYGLIRQIINKKDMLKIAKRAKIPLPKTFFPETKEDLARIREDIVFPCLVKPLERHLFYPVFKTKLFKIDNYDELAEKFELCQKNNLQVSVTELIPGGDMNLFSFECYVTKEGVVNNEFVKVKIRQTPPFFGVGRVSMSTENDAIIPLAKAFLAQLKGFCGPAYIEFKYDSRDGLYKFIEINGRLIISVSLSTRCGVNFPYILYSEHVESRLIETKTYERNVYWIQLCRDLVTSLSGESSDEHLTFFGFIRPYFGKKNFAFESLDDPKPMIEHWRLNCRSIKNKLRKKLGLKLK
jgi:predicted ATP-grasp superfamily ATP-dependent carboligase